MANFIVNSDSMVAVKKDKIVQMSIKQVTLYTDPLTYKFNVYLKLDNENFGHIGMTFESEDTLEAAQTKAATVLVALES